MCDNPRKIVEDFIKNIMAVQRYPGVLEIRMIKPEQWRTEDDVYHAKSYFISDLSELKDVYGKLVYFNKNKFNIYYGVNLRKEKKAKKGGGKKDVIDKVVMFYVDIDILHKDSIKNIDEFVEVIRSRKVRDAWITDLKNYGLELFTDLQNVGLPPAAIVISGWGLQIIFVSPRPIPKKEYEKYERAILLMVDDVLKRRPFEPRLSFAIKKHLKTEKIKPETDKIANVDRILRLPCFKNWRYKYTVQSQLVYTNWDARFRLDKVREYIPKAEEVFNKKKKVVVGTTGELDGEKMKGYGPYAWKGVVIMSDRLKKIAVDILKDYWVEGQRHDLSLVVAGYFRAFGYEPESVMELIQEIVEVTGDDEGDNRIQSVVDTYSKSPVKGGIKYSIRKFLVERIEASNFRADKKRRLIKEVNEKMKKLHDAVWQDIKSAKEENRLKVQVVDGKRVNKI
jgi:hypothetical protein